MSSLVEQHAELERQHKERITQKSLNERVVRVYGVETALVTAMNLLQEGAQYVFISSLDGHPDPKIDPETYLRVRIWCADAESAAKLRAKFGQEPSKDINASYNKLVLYELGLWGEPLIGAVESKAKEVMEALLEMSGVSPRIFLETSIEEAVEAVKRGATFAFVAEPIHDNPPGDWYMDFLIVCKDTKTADRIDFWHNREAVEGFPVKAYSAYTKYMEDRVDRKWDETQLDNMPEHSAIKSVMSTLISVLNKSQSEIE